MNRLAARKLFLYLGLAGALFVVLAWLFPAQALVQVFNGIFLGLVGAIVIVFSPLILRAVKQREFDGISQLGLGLILSLISLTMSRGLNVAGQVSGDLNRISPLAIAGAAYLAVMGGVLHITAPGMVENKWVYNKNLLIVAIGVGIVIGVSAILLQQSGPLG